MIKAMLAFFFGVVFALTFSDHGFLSAVIICFIFAFPTYLGYEIGKESNKVQEDDDEHD